MPQRMKTMKTHKLRIQNITAIHGASLIDAADTTTHVSDCLFWMALAFDYHTGKPDAGHIFRIGHYAALIAAALGYADDDVLNIAVAANLHDIGNISVPQSLLHKPTLLESHERLLMEKHCIEGATLLRSLPHPIADLAAIVAEAHHERLDGSGYPNGLTANNIPFPARIVAVADVFDALTTPNAVRCAMTARAAYRTIQSQSGTQLDADCVNALLAQHASIQEIVPAPGRQPSNNFGLCNPMAS
jgi:HD-GYP domain-containing protein (c-di-GMP phosphodiesterase class II)